MKCVKCNYENLPGAKFCICCGTPLSNESNKAPTNIAPTTPVATKTSPVAPVATPPVATPVYTPPVAVKKVLSPQEIAIRKAKTKATVFNLLQLLFYIAIIAVILMPLFLENGVKVQSTFKKSSFKEFALFDIIKLLVSGGDKYNPTMLSIIMGVSTAILCFGSAISWTAAFFAKIIKRFDKELHTLSLILTGLSIAVTAAIVPVAYRFSGILKQAIAREANMFVDDIASVNSIFAFVFAGICIALIVIELIFASKEKQSKKHLNEVMK